MLDGFNYGDFEFDEESGYYILKGAEKTEPYSEVTFDENGVLSAILMYNSNLSENPETEDMNVSAAMVFTNIGTTLIDVPEYSIAK